MSSQKIGWDHSQFRKYDFPLEQLPRLNYEDPKVDELMSENEQNLKNTLKCLQLEVEALVSGYELCDNVDLDTILQEFISFYYTKFNKTPKIVKKLDQPQHKQNKLLSQNSVEQKPLKVIIPDQEQKQECKQFEIQVKKMLLTDSDSEIKTEYDKIQTTALCLTYSKEWQELSDVIKNEIIEDYRGTSWDDCIGLESSKQLLKESVIYPLQYPQLFTGLTRPWKGILLYGPPGTGKTLLAKAVACESNMTFINLTSSTFVSKWRGESEKMIKVLFDLARIKAPSVIFIDEIDAIFCQCNGSNNDASKRFRCELLVQMDGIIEESESIFVLASTNRPWDLDTALLRRFEKRIFINLPSQVTRYELFKYFLKTNMHNLDDTTLRKAAEMTKFFSGSDIKLACKEACMKGVRNTLKKIKNPQNSQNETKPIAPSDEEIYNSIKATHSLTDEQLIDRYLEWNKKYGSY